VGMVGFAAGGTIHCDAGGQRAFFDMAWTRDGAGLKQ